MASLIWWLQAALDNLPRPWLVFVAVLVLCAGTRLVTGLQSRRKQLQESTQVVRIAPYWLPWVGHGISFARDPLKCVKSAR